MKKEEITRLFSGRVRPILERLDLDFGKVHEIRLRTGAPLQLICQKGEYFPDEEGRASTGTGPGRTGDGAGPAGNHGIHR